jgi:hypothetical protein
MFQTGRKDSELKSQGTILPEKPENALLEFGAYNGHEYRVFLDQTGYVLA